MRLDEARAFLLATSNVLSDPSVDAIDTYVEVGGNRLAAREAWVKVLAKLIKLEVRIKVAEHNHDHNAVIGHTTEADGGW